MKYRNPYSFPKASSRSRTNGIPAHPQQETRHPFWSFLLLKNNPAPLELNKTKTSHGLEVLKPSTAAVRDGTRASPSGWEAALGARRKVWERIRISCSRLGFVPPRFPTPPPLSLPSPGYKKELQNKTSKKHKLPPALNRVFEELQQSAAKIFIWETKRSTTFFVSVTTLKNPMYF